MQHTHHWDRGLRLGVCSPVRVALLLAAEVLVCSGGSDANTDLPCRAAVCETTVAFVVRRGNPRNIRGWEDLLQDGLQVRLTGAGVLHGVGGVLESVRGVW